MTTQLTSEQVFTELQDILCDILVLNAEDVTPSSKLMDDLDADSIAFLELTFRIRSDFGLQVPQAKVDEETLGLPLLDGMKRMEQAMGGTTLFEFMQQEATQPNAAKNPFNFIQHMPADAAEQAKVGDLAQQMNTAVPSGFDSDDSINSLKIRDLFRFITVDAYVNYILYLADSQERIEALGGADAMNAEAVAKIRQVNA